MMFRMAQKYYLFYTCDKTTEKPQFNLQKCERNFNEESATLLI